jgi:hypothetical protein
MVMPKKVPVEAETNIIDADPEFPDIEAFLAERIDPVAEGLTVAQDTIPLRAITAVINHTDEAECVLDDGSSIVAMSKDVWKRLGLPLRPDHQLLMENAGGGKNSTLGLLSNVPFTIGRSTFWLQVQVVNNCPCEVLLGRPFLTLTSCRTPSPPQRKLGDSRFVDPNSQGSSNGPDLSLALGGIERRVSELDDSDATEET